MFWKPNQTGQRKQKERTVARNNHGQTASREPTSPNRDTESLEIAVTARKHSSVTHSNRDTNPFFTSASANPPQPNSRAKKRAPRVNPFRAKTPEREENVNPHPSVLLRLKEVPTVYFLVLTHNFNRTMLRLNGVIPVARPLLAVSDLTR
jgi:hypothetical protein